MCSIKNFGFGLAILLLITLIGSCIKQPEYKIVPEIKSLDISFKKGATASDDDSLSFTITFQDGDGDLGINSGETSINSTDIASPFYYVYDTIRGQIAGYVDSSNINLKKYNSTNNTAYAYLNYRSIRKQLVQKYDTFPVINCSNWQPVSNGDTLYITNNLNAYNFIVTAYLKNVSNGTYTPYLTPGSAKGFPTCAPPAQGINGTFPVLSSDPGKSAPMDGTLTYNFTSIDIAFHPLVTGKTIRFDIYITDRAFHKSNVMSTEYTFQ